MFHWFHSVTVYFTALCCSDRGTACPYMAAADIRQDRLPPAGEDRGKLQESGCSQLWVSVQKRPTQERLGPKSPDFNGERRWHGLTGAERGRFKSGVS